MLNNVTDLQCLTRDEPLDPGPTPGWLEVIQEKGQESAGSRKLLSRLKIGEIMVMRGLITPAQRDRVLKRQARLGLPFGECCVRLKMIDQQTLSDALAWQFGHVYPAARSMRLGKDLVMVTDPFSPYAEAMRSINRELTTGWLTPDQNVLAITSAEPGEGRSHLAANLAVSFEQTGLRTLLIDADLRRPRLHSIFGAPQHPGLSRLLCGIVPQDSVRRCIHLKKLSLITAGPLPPNPTGVLSRNELRALLRAASSHYEVVIVDTPARAEFGDADIIAAAAGSALIIARKGRVRPRNLLSLKQSLVDEGVRVAGSVVVD